MPNFAGRRGPRVVLPLGAVTVAAGSRRRSSTRPPPRSPRGRSSASAVLWLLPAELAGRFESVLLVAATLPLLGGPGGALAGAAVAVAGTAPIALVRSGRSAGGAVVN
jgi:hypothetical protein